MYKNQKLNDNGIEICLFPMEVLNCTQGAGFTVNNTIDYGSYSHCGAYAYDLMGQDTGIDPAYAPVSVKVRKIENQEVGYGNRTWFSSIDKVKFPDGEIAYLHMYMVHCDDENMGHLAVNKSFAQGDIIFYEGTKGIGTGNHIHIEAMRSQSYTLPSLTRITEYDNNPYLKGVVKMVGAEPIQKIFYLNGTVTNANKAGTKFADKTFTDVPHINGIPEFIEYTVGPFDPSNKSDGWYMHNGKQYYVENHACATGWKKVNNCWYFFNPASGNNHKNDYETGEMLTGWVWLDDHWYYFNPANGIMQTGWVWSSAWQGWYYLYTSGAEAGQMAVSTWIDKVYYVGSDGKMYKDGIFTVDGVRYSFDNSGVATRL